VADRMVEPQWKSKRTPSPQKQRKAAKQRELSGTATIVEARSRGVCEVCDDNRATQIHHKAGRRVPGANHPTLLLHVCLFCHTEIHANPDWSYRHGHLIRPSTILEAVPDE